MNLRRIVTGAVIAGMVGAGLGDIANAGAKRVVPQHKIVETHCTYPFVIEGSRQFLQGTRFEFFNHYEEKNGRVIVNEKDKVETVDTQITKNGNYVDAFENTETERNPRYVALTRQEPPESAIRISLPKNASDIQFFTDHRFDHILDDGYITYKELVELFHGVMRYNHTRNFATKLLVTGTVNGCEVSYRIPFAVIPKEAGLPPRIIHTRPDTVWAPPDTLYAPPDTVYTGEGELPPVKGRMILGAGVEHLESSYDLEHILNSCLVTENADGNLTIIYGLAEKTDEHAQFGVRAGFATGSNKYEKTISNPNKFNEVVEDDKSQTRFNGLDIEGQGRIVSDGLTAGARGKVLSMYLKSDKYPSVFDVFDGEVSGGVIVGDLVHGYGLLEALAGIESKSGEWESPRYGPLGPLELVGYAVESRAGLRAQMGRNEGMKKDVAEIAVTNAFPVHDSPIKNGLNPSVAALFEKRFAVGDNWGVGGRATIRWQPLEFVDKTGYHQTTYGVALEVAKGF